MRKGKPEHTLIHHRLDWHKMEYDRNMDEAHYFGIRGSIDNNIYCLMQAEAHRQLADDLMYAVSD